MNPNEGPDSRSGADGQIDVFCDQFVDQLASADPVYATYLGVSGYDHLLTDLSPDGFAARDDLHRQALRGAASLPCANERERVAQEAFLERIGLAVEMADQNLDRHQVSVIDSHLHSVRSVFDLMPTETDHDWEQISSRLKEIPSALAQYQQTLRTEAEAGRVVAARQYREVVTQIQSWTGADGGKPSFFQTLVSGRSASDSLSKDLAQRAEDATTAVAEFGAFMAESLVPKGRSSDAVGAEQYGLFSRAFLGSSVDLAEAYDWGWHELKRIRDEMAATAQQILPGAELDQVLEKLATDPDRKIEGAENFREWMQDLSDRTLADLAETHFEIPEPIQRLECLIAPTDDGGIYYTGPSEDFSRPGRMWWSVPAGTTEFYPWREVTTVFHEGVPGHHLQVAQTVYRAELLNRWQRLACWVSGHGEGWALYAERLMEELGYLDDPADKLGMLDAQSFRAARVVVDIGLHCELPIPADNPFGFRPGETWDGAKVKEFMGAHCELDDAMLTAEVNRYLGWPGQAPSYKLGERVWLQARADAQARAGADFNLKQFHTDALNLGSIGLDPLQVALARL